MSQHPSHPAGLKRKKSGVGWIALGVLMSATALGQLPFGAEKSVRSVTGQFTVLASPRDTVPELATLLAADTNLLELKPALLAVSSERIKTALYRELGEPSSWQGRIHLALRPAYSADDQVLILSERFRDGWTYRVEFPEFVNRHRFVRAMAQVILVELANRNARGRSGEIPLWLVEGLSAHLLASREMQIILPPPRFALHGLTIRPQIFERKGDPQQRAHPGTDTLSLAQLSWPTEETLSGPDAEAYRRSSRLFVTELLRLKNGRQCLRAMLNELPGCFNWQTAFFRAFELHFSGQLDLEKWWTLQLVHFTGRTDLGLLTLEESCAKLDELLFTSVQVRSTPDELPSRARVTLQAVLREWDQLRQTPVVQSILRDLEINRLRAAPEVVELMDAYRKVLTDYLRSRDETGLILTSATLNTNIKLRLLLRETIRELDELDARRAALRPRPSDPAPNPETRVAPESQTP